MLKNWQHSKKHKKYYYTYFNIYFLASMPGDGARYSGLTPIVPNSTDQVPIWEFISTDSKLIFCVQRANCPRHTLENSWRKAISTEIVGLFDEFNAKARERGRTLHFQSLNYGYVRVQPDYGVDMVLDIGNQTRL